MKIKIRSIQTVWSMNSALDEIGDRYRLNHVLPTTPRLNFP